MKILIVNKSMRLCGHR